MAIAIFINIFTILVLLDLITKSPDNGKDRLADSIAMALLLGLLIYFNFIL